MRTKRIQREKERHHNIVKQHQQIEDKSFHLSPTNHPLKPELKTFSTNMATTVHDIRALRKFLIVPG